MAARIARAVHWHEGMFLRPHQLQAAQRHQVYLDHLRETWDQPYYWGLRSIDLDLEALSNHRLVVRSLQARLRDGTLINVPEDGTLSEVDLKPALATADTLTIAIGVPVPKVGQANVSPRTRPTDTHFLEDTDTVEDENTGSNPQSVQVRLLNLKLLLSPVDRDGFDTQDHQGYETLRIGRIKKSARADALPELEQNYIPPLLACSGWGPLAAGVLQKIYDQVGQKIDHLANQAIGRSITFDTQTQGDQRLLSQLRVLNEAYATLGILVFAEGIHPFPAYLELCRLVGQLSIFDPTRYRPPEIPRYEHDDLYRFIVVMRLIQDLIARIETPIYEWRDFVGVGSRMQVTMEPAWLEPRKIMYVGVKGDANLTAEECDRLLRGGRMNMKIGSSERVDQIFRNGEAGLKFTPSIDPHKALPRSPGLTYFQVSRESQDAEWQRVIQSGSLAIRLSERDVVGTIDKQKKLTVKTSGQNRELQFTLYIVDPRG